MYSVKPGRGPSFMGAIGGIIGVAFAIFWVIMASRIGAPPIMIVFGALLMVGMIATTLYHLYNTTQKNRVSHYDITTSHEETDPVARMLDRGNPPATWNESRKQAFNFCPYCGKAINDDFDYCPHCGKAF